MRRRDPSKGEGAIYLPVQQPLTPAEAEAQSKAGPRDEVAEARRLALDVMTHCYGRGVGIDQAGEPTRNGEPLPFPEVGAYPEILWDAWAVLDYARSVETLSRAATDAAFATHAAEIARGLAGAAVALGRTTERLAIRWEGFENIAASHQTRTANLTPGRRRVEIPAERLRAEWDRARRMRPHADKESLRRVLAERLGKSPGTIKRRLKESGIDPPEKKSRK